MKKRNVWKHAALNSAVIFIGLVFYTFLLNWMVIHIDWTWLQQAEAYSVFAAQGSMGIAATYNPAEVAIAYASPRFSMQIIALCTGISELLFFAFLVLLFMGPRWKTKAKGLAIFLPVIFVINLLRLLLIYPMALWLGVQGMWDVHWFIWKYGMFAALMALFTLWYWLWARKDLQETMKP